MRSLNVRYGGMGKRESEGVGGVSEEDKKRRKKIKNKK